MVMNYREPRRTLMARLARQLADRRVASRVRWECVGQFL